MTVSTTQNRITYNGNGVTTIFAFPYKFIETSDLVVYVGEVLQVEDVDYTVGTPSDSGANITFGTAPVSGASNVVILRDPDLLQETDLPTNGRLPADAIERMVDKVTLVTQRLRDLLDRTIRRNDADPANSTLVLPVAVANKALIFDENGELAVGVDDYLDQSANAAASAATASAAAVSAAASYDDFDDRYLGPKSDDPTLDNDGNALQVGALYYNSVTNKLRIYGASLAWQDTATATPASFTSNLYNGTGAQTAFTLSTTPASSASVIVSLSGVLQRPTTDYSISGTTLTFVVAPPLGTNNVLALVASTVAAGTPDNDSVSTAKIQNQAVTAAKLDDSIFDDLTTETMDASADFIVIADASESGNKKKALLPTASQTAKGIVELATAAEIKAGTDTVRPMAPDQFLAAIGFSARYNSGNQTITSAGVLTLAHGLVREPIIVQAWLKCTTAEAGYSIGDKLKAQETAESGISRGISIVADATNITIRFGSDANPFVILNKGTGVITAATNANWRLIVEALA